MCALAIMTSLYERATNTGQTNKVIDLSMVEGSAYLSTWLWTSHDIPGVWSGSMRGTNLLDGGYAAYETYETKDKKYMACGALERAFYEQFLKGLGLDKHDDIGKETVQKIFKTKTQQEWTEIFKDLDACVSPVLSLHEAPDHPHNSERKSFVRLGQHEHLPDMNWLKLNQAKRPFKMPQIGEHTRLVLEDAGLSHADIEQLLSDNVVEEAQTKSKL